MSKYSIERSPGPLIRRNHQIGLAIFAKHFKEIDLTPLQFSILWTLREEGEMDQVTLSQRVALDRNTCSNILGRLEKGGRIQRKTNPDNRRAKLVSLTAAGKTLINGAEKPMATVQKKLLAPLNAKEREFFLQCLVKLADSNNELSPAPMRYLPLK